MFKKKPSAGTVAGLCLWAAIIILCFVFRESITAESIVNFSPKNPLAAVLILMLLFAGKSLSVVMYIAVIYAASGIMFPFPAALLVNILGSAVAFTIPYLIGRRKGRPLADELMQKYPKFAALNALQSRSRLLFSIAGRGLGILPMDVVDAYFGATAMEPGVFYLGGLIGMIPEMLIYTVLGSAASDPSSPGFKISLICDVVIKSAAAVLCVILVKKINKETEKGK